MNDTLEFSIKELKPLLAQLGTGCDTLRQLIELLSGLTIKTDLPELDSSQLEFALVGQELILRRKKNPPVPPSDVIVGDDPKIQVALRLAQSMAETDDAVLIQGATGTGKSLFTRMIHQQGNRSTEAFVRVSSSMFNHPLCVTQAQELFAEAGTGTLVLENVEDLDSKAQTLLSNLLLKKYSCRLITQTRVDLDDLVDQNRFSNILLDRLRECYIALPALCDRIADIEPLTRFYCDKVCAVQGGATKQLAPECLQMLTLYTWPGNVRELFNTLDQSLLSARDQKTIYVRDLPAHIRVQTLNMSAARKKGL